MKFHTPPRHKPSPRPAWRRRFLWCGLVAAMSAGLAIEAQARVFRRWRAADAAVSALEAAGGTSAYSAPVRINDADGQVTALAFEASLPAVMRSTARVFGSETRVSGNDTLAIHRMTEGARRLDLVAVEIELERTLVFVVERRAARTADNPEPLAGLPIYPGATQDFSAEDRRARMQFGLASTSAPVETVLAYYHAALTAEGWVAPLEPDNAGLVVYLKPDRVCAVYAAAHRTGTRIALLHKPLDAIP